MKYDFTDEEKGIILYALYARKNYLETGVVYLSAVDAKNSNRSSIIKILSTEQKNYIEEIKNIEKKLLS